MRPIGRLDKDRKIQSGRLFNSPGPSNKTARRVRRLLVTRHLILIPTLFLAKSQDISRQHCHCQQPQPQGKNVEVRLPSGHRKKQCMYVSSCLPLLIRVVVFFSRLKERNFDVAYRTLVKFSTERLLKLPNQTSGRGVLARIFVQLACLTLSLQRARSFVLSSRPLSLSVSVSVLTAPLLSFLTDDSS
jgi:hypothetical protein